MKRRTLLGTGVMAAMAFAAATASPARFSLFSPALKPGARMPNAFVYDHDGCTGDNLSPPLAWRNAPAGTKSFALTVFDPDETSTGSGWWHWVLYDVPASVSSIGQGSGTTRSTALPQIARQGTSDLSEQAYHGPCPVKGDRPHRYVFTLYALPVTTLEVPGGATGAMVTATARSQALATAKLTVLYGQ